jgi:hypothetical protein
MASAFVDIRAKNRPLARLHLVWRPNLADFFLRSRVKRKQLLSYFGGRKKMAPSGSERTTRSDETDQGPPPSHTQDDA